MHSSLKNTLCDSLMFQDISTDDSDDKVETIMKLSSVYKRITVPTLLLNNILRFISIKPIKRKKKLLKNKSVRKEVQILIKIKYNY